MRFRSRQIRSRRLSFTDWDEARRTRVVAFSVAGYGLAILVALTYSLA